MRAFWRSPEAGRSDVQKIEELIEAFDDLPGQGYELGIGLVAEQNRAYAGLVGGLEVEEIVADHKGIGWGNVKGGADGQDRLRRGFDRKSSREQTKSKVKPCRCMTVLTESREFLVSRAVLMPRSVRWAKIL